MAFRDFLTIPPTNKSTGCLIVGEVAQTHDGSLGLAHAFVDAIAGAGADAVKFQTHIAAAESTPGEPWRVKFSRQDGARNDYWKRIEGFRWALLGSNPLGPIIAVSALVSVVLLVSGAFYFRRMERTFADVV